MVEQSGLPPVENGHNCLDLPGTTVPIGRTPVYLEGQGTLTVEQMKSAVQKGRLTETADTTPPNLSISECPRGRTRATPRCHLV